MATETVEIDRSMKGKIPAGWSAEGWIDYLKHKASVCRELHPALADWYIEWADSLKDPENDCA